VSQSPATAVSDAASVLSARHREVTRNEYGRIIVAGFSVTDGPAGSARVSHATPEPDLLDPERPSDDELAAARRPPPDGQRLRHHALGRRLDCAAARAVLPEPLPARLPLSRTRPGDAGGSRIRQDAVSVIA
jgi:hypothetical protein